MHALCIDAVDSKRVHHEARPRATSTLGCSEQRFGSEKLATREYASKVVEQHIERRTRRHVVPVVQQCLLWRDGAVDGIEIPAVEASIFEVVFHATDDLAGGGASVG